MRFDIKKYEARIKAAEENGWQRCHPYASIGDSSPAWFNLNRPECGYIYDPQHLPPMEAEPIPRCDVCNNELSACGPQNPDGTPSEDCVVCKLRAELDHAWTQQDRYSAAIIRIAEMLGLEKASDRLDSELVVRYVAHKLKEMDEAKKALGNPLWPIRTGIVLLKDELDEVKTKNLVLEDRLRHIAKDDLTLNQCRYIASTK